MRGCGYAAPALAKSSVGIGVLTNIDARSRVINRGFLLRTWFVVMTGCVRASSDALIPMYQYANLAQLVTLRLASSGDELKLNYIGDDHV